eukprot:scaffold85699_cov33-Tisochrysis_lutea.AAC.3
MPQSVLLEARLGISYQLPDRQICSFFIRATTASAVRRLTVLQDAGHLASFLCATLIIEPPCSMLSAYLNDGAHIGCEVRWARYISFRRDRGRVLSPVSSRRRQCPRTSAAQADAMRDHANFMLDHTNVTLDSECVVQAVEAFDGAVLLDLAANCSYVDARQHKCLDSHLPTIAQRLPGAINLGTSSSSRHMRVAFGQALNASCRAQRPFMWRITLNVYRWPAWLRITNLVGVASGSVRGGYGAYAAVRRRGESRSRESLTDGNGSRGIAFFPPGFDCPLVILKPSVEVVKAALQMAAHLANARSHYLYYGDKLHARRFLSDGILREDAPPSADSWSDAQLLTRLYRSVAVMRIRRGRFLHEHQLRCNSSASVLRRHVEEWLGSTSRSPSHLLTRELAERSWNGSMSSPIGQETQRLDGDVTLAALPRPRATFSLPVPKKSTAALLQPRALIFFTDDKHPAYAASVVQELSKISAFNADWPNNSDVDWISATSPRHSAKRHITNSDGHLLTGVIHGDPILTRMGPAAALKPGRGVRSSPAFQAKRVVSAPSDRALCGRAGPAQQLPLVAA